MEDLNSSRDAIDAIDRRLLGLLARRMEAVRAIAALKRKDRQAPLHDPEREREVFEQWRREGESQGLSVHFVGRVLREVLAYSRRDQERRLSAAEAVDDAPAVTIAYQGAPASYSDLALEKLFASRPHSRLSTIGYETFESALDALEAGEVDYAFLPIENTIAGSIHEVYREIAHRSVALVDEEIWQVEHCLAGIEGARVTDLRIVRSHAVALQQCGRFLRGLVGVRAESWYDTAAAAQSVAEASDPGFAAICSAEAARRLDLKILDERIADHPENHTRFVLVGRERETVDARVPAKTSILLTVDHRQGALAECLDAFAAADLNLSKLESRPQPEVPWEYLFYLDVEANVETPRMVETLDRIRPRTGSLRILGCYPSRSMVEREEIDSTPDLEAASPLAAQSVEAPAVAAGPGKPSLTGISTPGQRTAVRVGKVEIGGDAFTLIAGPCAVESREQILAAAEMVVDLGARLLRGGAFKPRSSPYSFQGLGYEGLDLLAEAREAYGLPIVTEVLRVEDLDRVAQAADMLQIGARNMQNFELLKAVGALRCPVLLKRGLSATIKEFLQAAEYVMAGGNHQVVLCERGIRTFENATRSTLDVSAVPVPRERTRLPVIVDPSHAAGRRGLVTPLALAAAAAGADGLMVEAHPRPDEALCDAEQALSGADLAALVAGLVPVVAAQGRRL
ncbi:MAG: bifunctional 3-deoxy-7-phosphoheptulonate synthase/chorismate mutase [Thermoanaerobaculia bacterium]